MVTLEIANEDECQGVTSNISGADCRDYDGHWWCCVHPSFRTTEVPSNRTIVQREAVLKEGWCEVESLQLPVLVMVVSLQVYPTATGVLHQV